MANISKYLQSNTLLYCALLILVTVFFIVNLRVLGDSQSSTIKRNTTFSDNPEKLVILINEQRKHYGLMILTTNQQLDAAAYKKAKDMCDQQYWSHVGPGEKQPWQWVIEEGYTYSQAGENLARDFSTAEEVINAWMASPTHQENILNELYKEIGTAVVRCTIDGERTSLIVQHYSNPSAAK